MEDILYADLVTLIGNNDLTPGEQYRITDYQTTYYIYEYGATFPFALTNTNVTDSGSAEPIIVSALTDTILSLEAKSDTYPGDTLYYTVDNIDAGVFASATGTITRRIDGINQIDMPYDYRVVQVTFNSENFLSIPSTSWNLRIGITASPEGVYTQTIPILIQSVARDVDISLVNDANGLIMDTLTNVSIGIVITLLLNIMNDCNLQSVDLTEAESGPGSVPITNFVGGYLSNLPSKTQTVCNLNNLGLSSSSPKIGIPGGYFVEMSVVGTETKCTYIGDFIP